MEAKLRNWFSRKPPASSDRKRPSPLRGQAYDNLAAGQAPIRGEYPVLGNGSHVVHRAKSSRFGEREVRLATEDSAEAPNVPRQRSESYSSRPRTAPQNNNNNSENGIHSPGRTRTGFSASTAPNFSKKPSKSKIIAKDQRSSRGLASPRSGSDRPPTALSSAYTAKSGLSQSSSYIDIFDAASSYNPSRSSSRINIRGFKDYGEDVADRNIAVGNSRPDYGEAVANRNIQAYGGGLDSRTWYRSSLSSQASSYNNPRGGGSGSGGERWGFGLGIGSSRGSGSVGSWNGSGHVNWAGAAGTSSSGRGGDDIPPQAPPTHYSNYNHHHHHHPQNLARYSNTSTTSHSVISSPSQIPPSQSSHSSSQILTTSPIIGVSTIPTSPLYENVRSGIPETQNQTLNFHPQVLDDSGIAFTIPQYTPPDSSRVYIPSRIDESTFDFNNYTPSTSNEGTAPSSKSSQFAYSASASTDPIARHLNHQDVVAAPAAKPVQSRYRDSAVQTLPTPPMSPTPTSQSSSASQHLPNLDKSLPERPREAARTEDTGDSTVRPHPFGGAHKRAGLVVEGATEPPSLEGIVDLSNTTDTEVITKELPAVVHERVKPEVHHITQEAVTREIHTHDVFHRIQPIKQIEVLPTKHYIPHPTIPNQLIEIPESAVPGRKNNWQVKLNEESAPDAIRSGSAQGVASEASQSSIVPPHQHAAHVQTQPLKVSERHYVDADGVQRSETVWQHAPTLETGGRETGQTVPLEMNCLPNPTTTESDANRTSRASATSEEGLLFKDDGYGVEGMLPGLDEPSPTKYPGSNENRNATGRPSSSGSNTTPTKPKQKVRSMLDIGEDDETTPTKRASVTEEEPSARTHSSGRLRRSQDEWDLRQHLERSKGGSLKGNERKPSGQSGEEVDDVTQGVRAMSMK